MMELSQQAYNLLQEQTRTWDILTRNSQTLAQCQTRTFHFNHGLEVICQFNPARIGSVTAKVDDESIRQRQCFLCDRNRPTEQKSLDCGNGYKLLCNPFPIVPEHFTLVHEQHRPQRIGDSVGDMLDLAKLLASRYIVFYNGPQCGASAPDHLHFQAGRKAELPADREYDRLKQPTPSSNSIVRAYVSPEGYLRRFVSFESADRMALLETFARFHDSFHSLQPRAVEPMMNAFCIYDESTDVYRLQLFPRHKHRPAFYDAADHTRMMISPGAVDIAGLIVMPMEDDFRRITAQDVIKTYREVTVDDETFAKLIRTL
jgi:hypothetical protein